MLTTETIEKAIEMFEGGATDSDVAERTGVSPAEARAVANALYLGETERLFGKWRLPACWSRRRWP